MSNSKLISYTKISPSKTKPRNHKIDTITIHCMAGQMTGRACADMFSNGSLQVSANYCIGYDGDIALSVEEKDRSWCSSSRSNDHRAITIEVASDKKHPYAVTDKAYKALIELLVDICKRNDIKELLWKGDKSLIGQVDKQNMTVHRWFANKACPGDYLYNKHGEIAEAVNAILNGVKGDVNCDGKVTAADARKILRAATGLEKLDGQAKANADVNGDGKITASDARKALRKANKLE